MEQSTDHRYCKALRIDGQPCRAWATSTGYCPLHGPNKKQIQVKGGLSKTRYHMLETRMNPNLKDVVNLLRQAASEVHEGRITPSQGSSLAAIATALIKAVESAELALRLSILEVRVNTGGGEFDDFDA